MGRQTLRFLLPKNHEDYSSDCATDYKWYRQYGFPDTERKGEICIKRSFLKPNSTRISPEDKLPWGDWVLCIVNETQGLESRKGEIIDWLIQQCGDRILNTIEIKSERYKKFGLIYHLVFTKNEDPLIPNPKKKSCIVELTAPESTDFVPPSYWDAIDITGQPEYSLYSIAANGVPE